MVNNLAKLAFVAGLVGVSLGSVGCTMAEIEQFLENKSSKGVFFACNYWEDKNQDGAITNDEYVGKKSSFMARENITLVAEVYNQRGSSLTTRIWNGASKLVYENKDPITFDACVRKDAFGPWELFNKGGSGEYSAGWFLNDNLIGTINFEVIK